MGAHIKVRRMTHGERKSFAEHVNAELYRGQPVSNWRQSPLWVAEIDGVTVGFGMNAYQARVDGAAGQVGGGGAG